MSLLLHCYGVNVIENRFSIERPQAHNRKKKPGKQTPNVEDGDINGIESSVRKIALHTNTRHTYIFHAPQHNEWSRWQFSFGFRIFCSFSTAHSSSFLRGKWQKLAK